MILHVDELHVSVDRVALPLWKDCPWWRLLCCVTSLPREAEGWHLFELEEETGQGRICTFVPVLPDSGTCVWMFNFD